MKFLGSVDSLLAATLYEGNPDMNHKLWNVISTQIYVYTGDAVMSLHIYNTCHKHFPALCSFMTYYRVRNYINMMGATSGAVTAYASGPPEFTPRF
jgi:hypothetical protein